MSFVHITDRPETLTTDWVAREYGALQARITPAEASATPQAWLELYADWNALKSYVGSEYQRLSYRYTKNMEDDAASEAERAHREEINPAGEDGDAALVAALLASAHRGAIAQRYGEQLMHVLTVQEPTLAPTNSELRVKEGELGSQYDKLVASAEVDVLGESLTLARARGRMSSSDAAIRKAAYDAFHGWFHEQHDVLAEIFNKQVALRDEMGRRLGHDNFVPLGYAGMERTDYGPAESAAFRASVLRHATPLFTKICAQQAAALGTATLRPWDVGYHPKLTLPTDIAEPIDEQLDKVGRAFERLSPRLAKHFERMRDENLIDLENRKGKGAGAYCTSFPDEERVVIFCNSTGDESDLGTLTHEMGHAFQAWESQWIDAVDLRWPTADACEIHSMGMEYLSLPYLDEFLNPEQLETFRRNRWRRGITLLCYVSVVDEFQHWVYEHPSATPGERDASWVEIHDRYMPGIDWSGAAAELKATRWYAQLHIFRYPFYYIDYAIAETGAMQLAMLDAHDHEGCLEKYLALCHLGGSMSLTGLLDESGLRSPFGGELMGELMEHAGGQLG